MRYPKQRLLCHFLTYSADLKANLPRPDSGDPKFRFTFTFAHSRFERLGTYRFMRKYSDIDLAFAVQKVSRCNSAGFNIPCRYPASFQSLQTVFTERHKIASRGIALHFAALAFTVFNSFWHHRHFFKSL
jgi:hypothetical protein